MDACAEIEAAEAALREAMLAGDADRLDAILADGAVFTSQDGARLGKVDDLAAHRSGLLRIATIKPRGASLVRDFGDTVIACVTLALTGRFDGTPFAGTFAYTRVWRRHGERWLVEAAHASTVREA